MTNTTDLNKLTLAINYGQPSAIYTRKTTRCRRLRLAKKWVNYLKRLLKTTTTN